MHTGCVYHPPTPITLLSYSEKAMTTAAAQEMLDRNAEIIRDILKLQEEASKPGGLRQAADLVERKEKLQAQLHRRLLKLARYKRTRALPCTFIVF